MRLLFVHERFGALGGAEANILATASELRRRGHTVGLAHGASTGREEPAWVDSFAECHSLVPYAHAPAAVSGAAPERLRAAMTRFQPDAIFLHKLADLELVGILAAGDVPVVRMVHDHDLYCLRGYKYNPLTRRICTRAASPYCIFPCGGTIARNPGGGLPFKWVGYSEERRELALNARFARLIVATAFMQQELERNGISPQQIEIHAPVPRATGSVVHCTFSTRNRLVYAGQVIRGKGVDVLLEALALVRVPFECHILGDGSHRGYCERLSRRLGLADRVHFAGFVPQSAIVEYYREATAGLMSSLWPEPFGAVGLEAMRCGLPVVAFDAGGIREWLIDGWNGRLVAWGDRRRYAGAVEDLLRDKPLARRLGEQGRQWVTERFAFSKYIDGLEDLFARVAGPRQVARSHLPVAAESPTPRPQPGLVIPAAQAGLPTQLSPHP
jgi:glycosyltransferase involved in cell wall biosynthesis